MQRELTDYILDIIYIIEVMQGQAINKPYQRACQALKSFRADDKYLSSLKDEQLTDPLPALSYAIKCEVDQSTKKQFEGLLSALQKQYQLRKQKQEKQDKEQENRAASTHRSQTKKYTILGLICSALFLGITYTYDSTQIKANGWLQAAWIILGILAVVFILIAIWRLRARARHIFGRSQLSSKRHESKMIISPQINSFSIAYFIINQQNIQIQQSAVLGPDMSQRYRLEELNLLQRSNNQTSYRSRRGHSGYGFEQFGKTNRSHQQDVSLRRNRVKSTDKETRKAGSELTVRFLKEKLSALMSQSTPKGMNIVKRKSEQTENQLKKSDSFRITAFRNSFRRKALPKAPENKEELKTQDTRNEFRVKEAFISKRQSANDPKQYERVGFNRSFLKFHGENKCFERAVQFKQRKKIGNGDKLVALLEKERFQIDHDNSLEYSSEELEINGDFAGWKKPIDKMEWSGFSNFEY